MIDLEVRGAENFAILARALKRVGDRELRRELYAGLNRATRGTRLRIKASLGQELPQRGGLARTMAGSRLSTRSRAGRDPGVRIQATASHDLKRMDKGRLRHPVFGTSKWVSQQINSGAFSNPIREDLPSIQQELLASMERVARQFLEKH